MNGSAELQCCSSFSFGSLRLPRVHSVASPPRGRPWRLSPLVVLRGISMIVLAVLCRFFLNANNCSCTLYYYVLLILSLLRYRIYTFLIYYRLQRKYGLCVHQTYCGRKGSGPVAADRRAFISDFSAGTEDIAPGKAWHKVSARFISTSDADSPPQKCIKAWSRLLPSKLSENLTLWA